MKLTDPNAVDPSLSTAAAKKKPGKGGGATAWVLLVFALGGGAFAVYDMVGRVRTQRDRADSLEGELGAARQRAGDAERAVAEAEAATARQRGEHETEIARLKGEVETVSDEARRAAERAEKADALAADLEKAVEKSEGELVRTKGKLTLNLVDQVLFTSGKAELTPRGKKVLLKIGESLNRFPDKQIWVIGHTDDKPIATPEFPSNWELSTARALNVVHFLQDEAKIDPKRLAAAGFGPYRPVSRSNRARNRRIEIVLFPAEVQIVED